jgi:hypothetical protein
VTPTVLLSLLSRPLCSHVSSRRAIQPALISLLHHSRAEHLDGLISVIAQIRDPQWLCIVAGLRRGGRLTKQRRREFYVLARETRHLELALNLLSSSKLEDMLGPDGAKSVLDAFFEQGATAYPLVEGLSQLQWPLLGDFALAPTLEIAGDRRGRVELELLGGLADRGLLKRGDQKLRWVGACLDACTTRWAEDMEDEKQVREAEFFHVVASLQWITRGG